MVVFAHSILKERPSAAIIGGVKRSGRLYDNVARHGGRPIMWKTGHSFIKSKTKRENTALGRDERSQFFQRPLLWLR
jgi:phosphomannomutase/phosphoglucomutase